MKNQKRGRNIAIAGLIVQSVMTLVIAIVMGMTGSLAAMPVLWILLGGIPLWLFTVIFFYARQLQRREEIELEELSGPDSGSGIFGDEEAEQLKIARRRVDFLRKWMMPAVTLSMAVYHVVMSFVVMNSIKGEDGTGVIFGVAPASAFIVLCIFASFLLSRYSTGLARGKDWLPLRAVGSYMLFCSILLAVLLLGILFDLMERFYPDLVLAWIFPCIQLVLGFELAINLILDIYRPRTGVKEPAPCYESRLLNLVAEPSRIGHSIADTLNYQFGFDVSGTWFYRLLSKVMIPLVAFGVLVMFAMSGVVIIRSGHRGVLKHFGKLNSDGVLQPGLHLKWPWPVDTVEIFPRDVVHEMVLGLGSGGQTTYDKYGEPVIMWSVEHGYRGQRELDFLIGATREGVMEDRNGNYRDGESSKAGTQIHIIKLVAVVRYRVNDVIKFNYMVDRPHEMVDLVAKRETIGYCASATLAERFSADPARPQAIMAEGRERAAEELKKRIQKKLDETGKGGMGVEITYVGIISAHPPKDVIPHFESVLSAERSRDTKRYKAEGKVASILAGAAGDLRKAYSLYFDMEHLDNLKEILKSAPGSPDFDRIIEKQEKDAEKEISNLRQRIRRDLQLAKPVYRRKSIDEMCEKVSDAITAEPQQTEKLQPVKQLGDLLLYETRLGYRQYVAECIDRLVSSVAAEAGNTQAERLGKELRKLTLRQHLKDADYQEKLLADYVDLIAELEDIRKNPAGFPFGQKIEKLQGEILMKLQFAQGEVARLMSEARADSWQERFRGQASVIEAREAMVPYSYCPQLYRFDRQAEIWEEYLPDMQKYVLGLDTRNTELRLNLEKENELLEGFGGEE